MKRRSFIGLAAAATLLAASPALAQSGRVVVYNAGGPELFKPLSEAFAKKHPDVKFIDFDDAPDYTKCECKNVLGVMSALMPPEQSPRRLKAIPRVRTAGSFPFPPAAAATS